MLRCVQATMLCSRREFKECEDTGIPNNVTYEFKYAYSRQDDVQVMTIDHQPPGLVFCVIFMLLIN